MTRGEYRKIVGAGKDRITTFAAWMIRDATEAADIAQEAMLRLWDRRAMVTVEAAQAWLFKTVRRLCIDHLRKKNGSHQATPLTFAETLATINSPPPEDHAAGAERTRMVAEAIAGLPPRDRALIVLRDMQGMSYERIGEILDCRTGTVKVGLHRARGRLREILIAGEVA